MTASIKLFAIRHLWKQKRPFPLAEKTREKKKKIEKGERGKEKRIQSDTECIRHVDTNSPTGRSNSHRCIFTELSRVTDCVAGFCTWTGCNDTSEYDRRRDGKNCGRSSRNRVTPRLFTRRTRTRVRSNVAAAAPVKCHGSRCSIISLPASHLHQQIFDDFCSCLSAWLTVSCYSVKCGLFFSFFFFFFPFFFFFFGEWIFFFFSLRMCLRSLSALGRKDSEILGFLIVSKDSSGVDEQLVEYARYLRAIWRWNSSRLLCISWNWRVVVWNGSHSFQIGCTDFIIFQQVYITDTVYIVLKIVSVYEVNFSGQVLNVAMLNFIIKSNLLSKK